MATMPGLPTFPAGAATPYHTKRHGMGMHVFVGRTFPTIILPLRPALPTHLTHPTHPTLPNTWRLPAWLPALPLPTHLLGSYTGFLPLPCFTCIPGFCVVAARKPLLRASTRNTRLRVTPWHEQPFTPKKKKNIIAAAQLPTYTHPHSDVFYISLCWFSTLYLLFIVLTSHLLLTCWYGHFSINKTHCLFSSRPSIKISTLSPAYLL